MPEKELIKENELFDRNEIYSNEINNKLKDVLQYVNNDVLSNDRINVSDDYLLENEDNLSLKLLKAIETFYINSQIKNIDFIFTSIRSTDKIISNDITRAKVHHLTELIEDISNKTFETGTIKFRGQIISLKSKDPDGAKNNISLGGIYEDLPVVATIKLNSDHYKSALEAHKYKQFITIAGKAKKTKTRVNFLDVESFEIEE
ncbi:hypothetical protein D3C80_1488270 [compost metagenome]